MRRRILAALAFLLLAATSLAAPPEKLSRRASLIRSFANRWIGTPYLWGGTTREGIDCSGYSRQMYRDLFDVEIPRTTKDQIHLGRGIPITLRDLGAGFEPGDLFFYVDSIGVPSHVIIYAGNKQFTHSVSPRGVVLEGMKALWGRRVVGRRALVPSKGGGPTFDAIPAAGPAVPLEIPCPPEIQAAPEDVRKFSRQLISGADIVERKDRELCEWKALARRLASSPSPEAKANVSRIEQQVEWLQSIEALRGVIDGQ
ncbi:MAG: C40 family peptidase [Deltaproteobacteria bacterium]|nr:C40 family peptidase [Deltaproteobacteria bacterium]